MLMKHVLLFEAEHDVGIMLRRTLEERGYSVIVTAALDVAHQKLQRAEFDLVIVNILLPDGAAFDLVEMARRRGIRAFFMTGSSSGSSRSRVAAAKTCPVPAAVRNPLFEVTRSPFGIAPEGVSLSPPVGELTRGCCSSPFGRTRSLPHMAACVRLATRILRSRLLT